jgi:hypothetical protein
MIQDLKSQSNLVKGPWHVEGHSFACGLYWKRGEIEWTPTPKILGRPPSGTKPIDMARQQGRYFLFRGGTLIHIGMTAPERLGKCLYHHTMDDLSPDWDHFSWFGFSQVNPDGTLGTQLKGVSFERFLSAMVAMMALTSEGCEFSSMDLAAAKLVQYKQDCSN